MRLTMAYDWMPMKAAGGGDTADVGLGLDRTSGGGADGGLGLDSYEGSRGRHTADGGLGLGAYEGS